MVAKNRFYQVPHCNGGGYRDPSPTAEMRAGQGRGRLGGDLCTEQTEIHHSSEITPFIELRLWDDADMPMLTPHRRGDPRARRAGRHRALPTTA